MNRVQQRQLYEKLVLRYSPEVGAAFLEAVSRKSTSVPFNELLAAVNRGDQAAVAALLSLTEGELFLLTEVVRTAFVAGGVSAAEAVSRGDFGFNGRHARAELWVARESGSLISAIQQDTIEAVRIVMTERVATGESGQKTALRLVGKIDPATKRRAGGILGLSPPQIKSESQAVIELLNLDPNYLTRNLRDRRFDKMVQRSIDSGIPLTAEQRNRIIGRYHDRMLKYRAEVIARTEAHKAISAGQWEGMLQAADSGVLITKRWIHGFSKEPRGDHLSLSSAPSRRLQDPFTMGDGSVLMFPHDPNASARHVVNCRCSVYYRVV